MKKKEQKIIANQIQQYLKEGHFLEEIHQDFIEQGYDEALWQNILKKLDKPSLGKKLFIPVLLLVLLLLGGTMYFLFFKKDTTEFPPLNR